MTGAARAQPPNQRMQLSGALSSGLRPVLPAAHSARSRCAASLGRTAATTSGTRHA